MRKVIYIVIVIIFVNKICLAQGSSGFGLKGGATLATLKSSSFSSGFNFSSGSKIGFYGGLFASVGLTEKFAVQPEIVYSNYSSKVVLPNIGEGVQNLNYVDISLLAKYIQDGLLIFLGPQVGLLVSQKTTVVTTIDLKPFYKSSDISGIIGASYTTLSGLGFDARYKFGLSNIASDDFSTFGGGKIKNNAFTFGIHYIFNHSGK